MMPPWSNQFNPSLPFFREGYLGTPPGLFTISLKNIVKLNRVSIVATMLVVALHHVYK